MRGNETFIQKKKLHITFFLSHFLFALVLSPYLLLLLLLYASYRFFSLTIHFYRFQFFDVFGRTKTENKLLGIITRFHLLTAHSIQFQIVTMNRTRAEGKEKNERKKRVFVITVIHLSWRPADKNI